MYTNLINPAVFLALSTSVLAQIDFDDIFGSDSNCNGVAIQGYCCPGSILGDGDFANNNNINISSLICCVGDPDQAFNNGGDSTCTAGTSTPLTAVTSGAGSIAPTASPTGSSSSDSPAVTSSSASSISGDDAMTTSSAMITSTSEGEQMAQTSSSSTADSSTGGAVRAMITAAPVLAGGMMGVFALF